MTREEAIAYGKRVIDLGLNDETQAFCEMAIKALEQVPNRQIEDYENEIEDLHNRLDIAEYDKERLREEVTNLEAKIKALEQEPILDEIRAEIKEQRDNVIPCIAYPADAYADGKLDAYNRCLNIIDKYRKETE